MKKSVIVSVISGIAMFGMLSGTASAWYYTMSGSGVCQPDGSYKITWTVNNTSEPTQLEVRKSSNVDVVKVGETIPARQSENFYQTVDGTKPGAFKLELTADWKEDRSNMKRSATVTLNEACQQPEEPETPQTPETPTNGGGQVLGQVTVVPQGAVNAGEGQGTNYLMAATGLVLSIGAIVYGLVRLVKPGA